MLVWSASKFGSKYRTMLRCQAGRTHPSSPPTDESSRPPWSNHSLLHDQRVKLGEKLGPVVLAASTRLEPKYLQQGFGQIPSEPLNTFERILHGCMCLSHRNCVDWSCSCPAGLSRHTNKRNNLRTIVTASPKQNQMRCMAPPPCPTPLVKESRRMFP